MKENFVPMTDSETNDMTKDNLHSNLKAAAETGIDYPQYREQVNFLLKQNKTTGTDHSESRVSFTRLNVQRMKRLDKTIGLIPELVNFISELKKNYTFLVINEAWCGDGAQNLPIIAKMAELSDKIDVRIIYRDEHPEIMDAFLTNEARAIPKLIAMEKDCSVLGTWGPRPKPAQDMVMEHKRNPQKGYEEFQKDLQLWYAKDKGKTIQQEFIECLHHWENKKVALPCPEIA